MTKNTFIFNFDWADALAEQPDDIRLAVYDAIIIYAKTGEAPRLQPLAKLAFSFIKKQMDRNAQNYDAMIQARSEAGRKGGAPKGNTNANKTSKTSKNNQNQAKQAKQPYIDNDNDIDNDNVINIKENIYIKEKENIQNSLFPTEEQPTPQQPPRTLSEHERLLEYIRTHAPYIATHYKHLITEEEMKKLLREYSKQEIANTIDNIENRQDLRKKYVNLYRTLLNWLKNDSINKRP